MNRSVALKPNKFRFVIIITTFFHYICVRNNLIFLEAVNTITLAKFKMAVHAHATIYDVDFKTTCLQHQARTRTTKAPPIGRLVLIHKRRTQLTYSNCTVYCWNFLFTGPLTILYLLQGLESATRVLLMRKNKFVPVYTMRTHVERSYTTSRIINHGPG